MCIGGRLDRRCPAAHINEFILNNGSGQIGEANNTLMAELDNIRIEVEDSSNRKPIDIYISELEEIVKKLEFSNSSELDALRSLNRNLLIIRLNRVLSALRNESRLEDNLGEERTDINLERESKRLQGRLNILLRRQY